MVRTRAEILAEARSWRGTPYHEMGRLKGVGVDCVGVVMGLAGFCGIQFDPTAWVYNRYAEGVNLDLELGRFLEKVPDADAVGPGHVLTFWVRHPGQVIHCGV